MKDCIELYDNDNEKPELLLSAYQLNDGNITQIIQALHEIAFCKSIIMTTEELGQEVLRPLFAENHLNAAISPKSAEQTIVGEMVSTSLAKCPVCQGFIGGSRRECPCSYCAGTGRYTKMAYAFFLHHICDCSGSTRCDVCHGYCHHVIN